MPPTTAARRAQAKRGSAPDGWDRVTLFTRRGTGKYRIHACKFGEMGVPGEDHCVFPRPGFFWFLFFPVKKRNNIPVSSQSASLTALPEGEPLHRGGLPPHWQNRDALPYEEMNDGGTGVRFLRLGYLFRIALSLSICSRVASGRWPKGKGRAMASYLV